MKCLERNKKLIYYANFQGVEPILSDEGYETGESAPQYSSPTPLKINVSSASGENATRLFGDFIDYDKTLVTSDMNLTISEESVFWIDETDISQPFDYIVKKVAKGLNSILIAVKKVEVS